MNDSTAVSSTESQANVENTPSAAEPKKRNPARLVLQQLADKYPVIKQALPLAIGINKQLAELHPEIDQKSLRAALFHHTRSFAYVKTLSKAEHRVDLAGNPAGEINDDQRQHALAQLKEIANKRNEAKRAAELQKRQAEEAEKRAQKLGALVEKFGRR